VAWQASIGSPPAGSTTENSPVIDQSGNIYQVGSASANTTTLYSFGPTGSALWTAALDPQAAISLDSTPALLNVGLVALIAQTGLENLFYLTSTGGTLSGLAYPAFFASRPKVDGEGRIFCASTSGGGPGVTALVYATSSGAPTLLASLSPIPFSAASVPASVALDENDTSYWGSGGQVVAVGAPFTNFQPLQSWPPEVTVATVAEGTTATGAIGTQVALDLATGGLIVAASWETGNAGSYAVQGVVSALDPSDGSIQWSTQLPAAALPATWTPLPSDSGNSAPGIGADGTLYVGAGDGLRALNGSTGSVVWTFSSANVSSSPAIGGDGTIFFGAQDGTFYAVTATGQQRFTISTGGPISSAPAISLDGTVVFASDDGMLYSLE
jgi:outer membrane protein assembly factor BamB